MNLAIGEFLIGMGIMIAIIGEIGIIKYKTLYKCMLVSSLIDTVAPLTIFIGVIIRQGFNLFSLKVLIIIFVILIINPITTHKIARSAYLSGYKENDIEDESEEI